MNNSTMHTLLQKVSQGTLSVEEALQHTCFQQDTCSSKPHAQAAATAGTIVDTLCGLTLDTSREARTGLGEVVFAPNKSPAQLLSAIAHLHEATQQVLVSRVQDTQFALLREHFPQGSCLEEGRLFSLGRELPCTYTDTASPKAKEVIVISAGGADRPVALEAYGALHFWGIEAGFIADVGVAGLHRLTPHVPALQAARIIIAVAGMEGALPGIIAGFVRCPVVAVPTSVGYGVGAQGKAALTSMLCSCVPGIAVCNIDNGFGAAAFAAKMVLA